MKCIYRLVSPVILYLYMYSITIQYICYCCDYCLCHKKTETSPRRRRGRSSATQLRHPPKPPAVSRIEPNRIKPNRTEIKWNETKWNETKRTQSDYHWSLILAPYLPMGHSYVEPVSCIVSYPSLEMLFFTSFIPIFINSFTCYFYLHLLLLINLIIFKV